MLLLHRERQLEVLNMERQCLGVEHTQHIHLLCNLIHAALELTDTLLLICLVVQNLGHYLRCKGNLLREPNLLECCRKKIVFSNRCLLLLVLALKMHHHHTIQKNTINTVHLVRTKCKHHLAQINGNATQILVLKVAILHRISQVNKHIGDLLALIGRTNLIQLIKEQNKGH